MKWTELKSFSFKDLISSAIMFIYIVVIGFFLWNDSNSLLKLIEILTTPVIWIISLYSGTEGLELIKGKLENSDALDIPKKEGE